VQYILDSSVIVKWFSHDGEKNVDKALRLMDLYERSIIEITIPDLSLYEIANALRYNKNFSPEDVKKVIATLEDMGLNILGINGELMALAIDIAFKDNITVYDAIFISASNVTMMPLVTANPRHQKNLKRGNIIILEDLKN